MRLLDFVKSPSGPSAKKNNKKIAYIKYASKEQVKTRRKISHNLKLSVFILKQCNYIPKNKKRLKIDFSAL